MLKSETAGIEISGAAQVFGIIGNPLAQSLSPVFWNKALHHLGIDAVYIPIKAAENDFLTAFSGLRACGFVGINVTMPFKKLAADYCDILHPPADLLRVVNTVRFAEKIEGWNTDATGLARIISEFARLKTALIMGNGASAESTIQALARNNITRILQIARKHPDSQPGLPEKQTPDTVKKLAWNYKNFAYAIKESDIIINTTPLGWNPDDFVVELEEFLDQSKIYVDLNYAPASKLLATARKRCQKVIDGRELLLAQGLESFRILTGHAPPEQVIRKCIYSQV